MWFIRRLNTEGQPDVKPWYNGFNPDTGLPRWDNRPLVMLTRKEVDTVCANVIKVQPDTRLDTVKMFTQEQLAKELADVVNRLCPGD